MTIFKIDWIHQAAYTEQWCSSRKHKFVVRHILWRFEDHSAEQVEAAYIQCYAKELDEERKDKEEVKEGKDREERRSASLNEHLVPNKTEGSAQQSCKDDKRRLPRRDRRTSKYVHRLAGRVPSGPRGFPRRRSHYKMRVAIEKPDRILKKRLTEPSREELKTSEKVSLLSSDDFRAEKERFKINSSTEYLHAYYGGSYEEGYIYDLELENRDEWPPLINNMIYDLSLVRPRRGGYDRSTAMGKSDPGPPRFNLLEKAVRAAVEQRTPRGLESIGLGRNTPGSTPALLNLDLDQIAGLLEKTDEDFKFEVGKNLWEIDEFPVDDTDLEAPAGLSMSSMIIRTEPGYVNSVMRKLDMSSIQAKMTVRDLRSLLKRTFDDSEKGILERHRSERKVRKSIFKKRVSKIHELSNEKLVESFRSFEGVSYEDKIDEEKEDSFTSYDRLPVMMEIVGTISFMLRTVLDSQENAVSIVNRDPLMTIWVFSEFLVESAQDDATTTAWFDEVFNLNANSLELFKGLRLFYSQSWNVPFADNGRTLEVIIRSFVSDSDPAAISMFKVESFPRSISGLLSSLHLTGTDLRTLLSNLDGIRNGNKTYPNSVFTRDLQLIDNIIPAGELIGILRTTLIEAVVYLDGKLEYYHRNDRKVLRLIMILTKDEKMKSLCAHSENGYFTDNQSFYDSYGLLYPISGASRLNNVMDLMLKNNCCFGVQGCLKKKIMWRRLEHSYRVVTVLLRWLSSKIRIEPLMAQEEVSTGTDGSNSTEAKTDPTETRSPSKFDMNKEGVFDAVPSGMPLAPYGYLVEDELVPFLFKRESIRSHFRVSSNQDHNETILRERAAPLISDLNPYFSGPPDNTLRVGAPFPRRTVSGFFKYPRQDFIHVNSVGDGLCIVYCALVSVYLSGGLNPSNGWDKLKAEFVTTLRMWIVGHRKYTVIDGKKEPSSMQNVEGRDFEINDVIECVQDLFQIQINYCYGDTYGDQILEHNSIFFPEFLDLDSGSPYIIELRGNHAWLLIEKSDSNTYMNLIAQELMTYLSFGFGCELTFNKSLRKFQLINSEGLSERPRIRSLLNSVSLKWFDPEEANCLTKAFERVYDIDLGTLASNESVEDLEKISWLFRNSKSLLDFMHLIKGKVDQGSQLLERGFNLYSRFKEEFDLEQRFSVKTALREQTELMISSFISREVGSVIPALRREVGDIEPSPAIETTVDDRSDSPSETKEHSINIDWDRWEMTASEKEAARIKKEEEIRLRKPDWITRIPSFTASSYGTREEEDESEAEEKSEHDPWASDEELTAGQVDSQIEKTVSGMYSELRSGLSHYSSQHFRNCLFRLDLVLNVRHMLSELDSGWSSLGVEQSVLNNLLTFLEKTEVTSLCEDHTHHENKYVRKSGSTCHKIQIREFLESMKATRLVLNPLFLTSLSQIHLDTSEISQLTDEETRRLSVKEDSEMTDVELIMLSKIPSFDLPRDRSCTHSKSHEDEEEGANRVEEGRPKEPKGTPGDDLIRSREDVTISFPVPRPDPIEAPIDHHGLNASEAVSQDVENLNEMLESLKNEIRALNLSDSGSDSGSSDEEDGFTPFEKMMVYGPEGRQKEVVLNPSIQGSPDFLETSPSDEDQNSAQKFSEAVFKTFVFRARDRTSELRLETEIAAPIYSDLHRPSNLRKNPGESSSAIFSSERRSINYKSMSLDDWICLLTGSASGFRGVVFNQPVETPVDRYEPAIEDSRRGQMKRPGRSLTYSDDELIKLGLDINELSCLQLYCLKSLVLPLTNSPNVSSLHDLKRQAERLISKGIMIDAHYSFELNHIDTEPFRGSIRGSFSDLVISHPSFAPKGLDWAEEMTREDEMRDGSEVIRDTEPDRKEQLYEGCLDNMTKSIIAFIESGELRTVTSCLDQFQSEALQEGNSEFVHFVQNVRKIGKDFALALSSSSLPVKELVYGFIEENQTVKKSSVYEDLFDFMVDLFSGLVEDLDKGLAGDFTVRLDITEKLEGLELFKDSFLDSQRIIASTDIKPVMDKISRIVDSDLRRDYEVCLSHSLTESMSLSESYVAFDTNALISETCLSYFPDRPLLVLAEVLNEVKRLDDSKSHPGILRKVMNYLSRCPFSLTGSTNAIGDDAIRESLVDYLKENESIKISFVTADKELHGRLNSDISEGCLERLELSSVRTYERIVEKAQVRISLLPLSSSWTHLFGEQMTFMSDGSIKVSKCSNKSVADIFGIGTMTHGRPLPKLTMRTGNEGLGESLFFSTYQPKEHLFDEPPSQTEILGYEEDFKRSLEEFDDGFEDTSGIRITSDFVKARIMGSVEKHKVALEKSRLLRLTDQVEIKLHDKNEHKLPDSGFPAVSHTQLELKDIVESLNLVSRVRIDNFKTEKINLGKASVQSVVIDDIENLLPSQFEKRDQNELRFLSSGEYKIAAHAIETRPLEVTGSSPRCEMMKERTEGKNSLEVPFLKNLSLLHNHLLEIVRRSSSLKESQLIVSHAGFHNIGVIVPRNAPIGPLSSKIKFRYYFVVSSTESSSEYCFYPELVIPLSDGNKIMISRQYIETAEKVIHRARLYDNTFIHRQISDPSLYQTLYWSMFWINSTLKGVISMFKYLNVVLHSDLCKFHNLMDKYIQGVPKRQIDWIVLDRIQEVLESNFNKGAPMAFLGVPSNLANFLEMNNIYTLPPANTKGHIHDYQMFYDDILNNITTREKGVLDGEFSNDFSPLKHVNRSAFELAFRQLQNRSRMRLTDNEYELYASQEFSSYFITTTNGANPYNLRKEKNSIIYTKVILRYLEHKPAGSEFDIFEFLDYCLDEVEARGAKALISIKAQKDVANREIVIQDFFTKAAHFHIQKVFQNLDGKWPEELVSKSEFQKLDTISKMRFSENSIFFNDDMKKWSGQDIKSKFSLTIDMCLRFGIITPKIHGLLRRSYMATERITLLFDNRLKRGDLTYYSNDDLARNVNSSRLKPTAPSKGTHCKLVMTLGWPQGLMHFISSFVHGLAALECSRLVKEIVPKVTHCLITFHSDDKNGSIDASEELTETEVRTIVKINAMSALGFSLAQSNTKPSVTVKGTLLDPEKPGVRSKKISEMVSVYNVEGTIMNSWVRQASTIFSSLVHRSFVENHLEILSRCVNLFHLSNEALMPEHVYSYLVTSLKSFYGYDERLADNTINWGGTKDISISEMSELGIQGDTFHKFTKNPGRIYFMANNPMLIAEKPVNKKFKRMINNMMEFNKLINFKKIGSKSPLSLHVMNQIRKVTSLGSGLYFTDRDSIYHNLYRHRKEEMYRPWIAFKDAARQRRVVAQNELKYAKGEIGVSELVTTVIYDPKFKLNDLLELAEESEFPLIDESVAGDERFLKVAKEVLSDTNLEAVHRSSEEGSGFYGLVVRLPSKFGHDFSTEYEDALELIHKGDILKSDVRFIRSWDNMIRDIGSFCESFGVKSVEQFEDSKNMWEFHKKISSKRNPLALLYKDRNTFSDIIFRDCPRKKKGGKFVIGKMTFDERTLLGLRLEKRFQRVPPSMTRKLAVTRAGDFFLCEINRVFYEASRTGLSDPSDGLQGLLTFFSKCVPEDNREELVLKVKGKMAQFLLSFEFNLKVGGTRGLIEVDSDEAQDMIMYVLCEGRRKKGSVVTKGKLVYYSKDVPEEEKASLKNKFRMFTEAEDEAIDRLMTQLQPIEGYVIDWKVMEAKKGSKDMKLSFRIQNFSDETQEVNVSFFANLEVGPRNDGIKFYNKPFFNLNRHMATMTRKGQDYIIARGDQVQPFTENPPNLLKPHLESFDELKAFLSNTGLGSCSSLRCPRCEAQTNHDLMIRASNRNSNYDKSTAYRRSMWCQSRLCVLNPFMPSMERIKALKFRAVTKNRGNVEDIQKAALTRESSGSVLSYSEYPEPLRIINSIVENYGEFSSDARSVCEILFDIPSKSFSNKIRLLSKDSNLSIFLTRSSVYVILKSDAVAHIQGETEYKPMVISMPITGGLHSFFTVIPIRAEDANVIRGEARFDKSILTTHLISDPDLRECMREGVFAEPTVLTFNLNRSIIETVIRINQDLMTDGEPHSEEDLGTAKMLLENLVRITTELHFSRTGKKKKREPQQVAEKFFRENLGTLRGWAHGYRIKHTYPDSEANVLGEQFLIKVREERLKDERLIVLGVDPELNLVAIPINTLTGSTVKGCFSGQIPVKRTLEQREIEKIEWSLHEDAAVRAYDFFQEEETKMSDTSMDYKTRLLKDLDSGREFSAEEVSEEDSELIEEIRSWFAGLAGVDKRSLVHGKDSERFLLSLSNKDIGSALYSQTSDDKDLKKKKEDELTLGGLTKSEIVNRLQDDTIDSELNELIRLVELETSLRSSILASTLEVLIRSIKKDSNKGIITEALRQLKSNYERYFNYFFVTFPEHPMRDSVVSLRSFRSEKMSLLQNDCMEMRLSVLGPLEVAGLVTLVNSVTSLYERTPPASDLRRDLACAYVSLNAILRAVSKPTRNYKLFIMPEIGRPLEVDSAAPYACSLAIFRWLKNNAQLASLFGTSKSDLEKAIRRVSH